MSVLNKELGKIQSVEFGYCGYQDALLGIHLKLEFKGSGAFFESSFWDFNKVTDKEDPEWVNKRDEACVQKIRYVSSLLKTAKVNNISELKGVPIEADFEGNKLVSFRILKDVL